MTTDRIDEIRAWRDSYTGREHVSHIDARLTWRDVDLLLAEIDRLRSARLSHDTLEAALNCVDACADDRREPERYRQWYSRAAVELRAYKELLGDE